MPTHNILATGLQFPEGPVIDKDGSILLVEIERRTITRVKDGESSVVAAFDLDQQDRAVLFDHGSFGELQAAGEDVVGGHGMTVL